MRVATVTGDFRKRKITSGKRYFFVRIRSLRGVRWASLGICQDWDSIRPAGLGKARCQNVGARAGLGGTYVETGVSGCSEHGSLPVLQGTIRQKSRMRPFWFRAWSKQKEGVRSVWGTEKERLIKRKSGIGYWDPSQGKTWVFKGKTSSFTKFFRHPNWRWRSR